MEKIYSLRLSWLFLAPLRYLFAVRPNLSKHTKGYMHYSYMKKYIVAGLFVLLTLSPVSAPAAGNPVLAARLMVTSSMSSQVQLFHDVVSSGIKRRLQDAGHLSDRLPGKLQKAVDQQYSTGALRDVLRQKIVANFNSNDMEQIIAWLESPLGQKTSRVEKSAGQADVQAYTLEVAKTLNPKKLDADRLRLLDRLDKALGYTTGSIDTSLQAQIAMTLVSMANAGPIDGATLYQVNTKYAGFKNKIPKGARQQIFASLYVTYMSLSNNELQKYILFARSELGNAYIEVSSRAMLETLKHANKEFVRNRQISKS